MCNHRCPDSVYFNTVFLSIYLSGIETLTCHREMSLIGSTSFGFAQNNNDTWFSKYPIELIVALFLTNAAKKLENIVGNFPKSYPRLQIFFYFCRLTCCLQMFLIGKFCANG